MNRSRGTTAIGYENKNGQVVVKKTDRQGTDYGQRVYILRCKNCDKAYGANGSDIWARRCPSPLAKCPTGGGCPGI